MVDFSGTVIAWPNRPQWRALPFKTILETQLGVPVTVEDDANAAALAEWRFGAGRGYQHLMVVMVGTGVGCGLILNSKLFRGQTGWAGELGHLVMLRDGMECPCGHRGCLQTVASGRALERVALARSLPDAAALVKAAEEGQEWASEELAVCGSWLGLAAANVSHLLDLEAVIIGGGLSGLSAPWWQSLTETFDANLLNRSHRQIKLHQATLAETAGLRGATSLAWESVAEGA
jgi:glucokinase